MAYVLERETDSRMKKPWNVLPAPVCSHSGETVSWQRVKARVLENVPVAPGRYLLRAKAPSMDPAYPGQFLHVLTIRHLEPFLRRPFSVALVEGDEFHLLYAVAGRGKGSQALARFCPGDDLDVMGPLGKGFPLTSEDALLVAGGMGIAPLIYLAHCLQGQGASVRMIVGAKTSEDLVGLDYLPSGCHVTVTTDDGSRGYQGNASEIMMGEMDKRIPSAVYACGPSAMLDAVGREAIKKNIDCHLSLEARLACGVGACLGCAVRGRQGYLRVCRDGPVFDAREVEIID